MATAVILALSLLICLAESQICGQGLYPGLLGLDGYGSVPCGPGPCGPLPSAIGPLPPQIGPLPPQIGPLSPQIGPIPCGAPASGCGIPTPCGISAPCIPPGIPVGQYLGPIGAGVPPCAQVPCGIPAPCGIQPCGVQCGLQVPQCGVPIPQCLQAPILNAPFIPNQYQCSLPNQCGQCGQCFGPMVPTCDYTQGPVTTVVDNTLANSLANALQLLIVSNLLENTLAPLAYPCEGNFGSVLEYPCNQITCEPKYEVVTPITYPCQEPVVSFAPCIEIPVFGQDITCDNYGLVNPFANSFGNYGNSFGLSDCGLVNPYANGFGNLESVFAPVAAEVLFPAEIPAQLTCNFGYMTSNVPCVSVNVEPLPFCPC